jgi:hypothetical protein
MITVHQILNENTIIITVYDHSFNKHVINTSFEWTLQIFTHIKEITWLTYGTTPVWELLEQNTRHHNIELYNRI